MDTELSLSCPQNRRRLDQQDSAQFSTTTISTDTIPRPGLIFDASGNLYGTTVNGGDYLYGTAFELSPSAGNWTEQILHGFGPDTTSDGWFPQASLVFDSAGNLYGTAPAGVSTVAGPSSS